MPVRTATRYTVCATSKEKANEDIAGISFARYEFNGSGFTAFILLCLDAQDELLGIIVLVEGGDHELL